MVVLFTSNPQPPECRRKYRCHVIQWLLSCLIIDPSMSSTFPCKVLTHNASTVDSTVFQFSLELLASLAMLRYLVALLFGLYATCSHLSSFPPSGFALHARIAVNLLPRSLLLRLCLSCITPLGFAQHSRLMSRLLVPLHLVCMRMFVCVCEKQSSWHHCPHIDLCRLFPP